MKSRIERKRAILNLFYIKKQKPITKHPKSLHIKVLQNLSWKVNSTKNRIVEFDTPFSKNISMTDYFRHVFKSSMKALIVKGKKKCLQNRHKRKHCWALDATVKIADARSLRSEGQMFFFGEKSNLDFAFRPPKAAAYIHRAHLVSKNFEEFCSHLLRWQIRIRKVESM